jgi:hypothetical protein
MTEPLEQAARDRALLYFWLPEGFDEAAWRLILIVVIAGVLAVAGRLLWVLIRRVSSARTIRSTTLNASQVDGSERRLP